MITLPRLFKRTKTGDISYWDVSTNSNLITKESGQLGTINPLVYEERVKGKNIGRSNETTPGDQAELEAISAWRKKKDEGMKDFRDLGITDESQLGKALPKYNTDAKGMIKPMLATDWKKVKSINYPVMLQPKLDGVRCLMRVTNGEVIFQTRSGKTYTSLDHIAKDVLYYQRNVNADSFYLDGEIYSDDLTFQGVIKAVKTINPYNTLLHFRAYDIVSDENQVDRYESVFRKVEGIKSKYVSLVQTRVVTNEAEVKECHDDWVRKGYEGGMIRLPGGKYEQGCRSRSLLKVKEFDEREFDFVDWEQGKRPEDLIAVCMCAAGIFRAKMMGTVADKADIETKTPKLITVKHFGWTDDKYPRFPVGKAIRDYE